MCGICGIFTTDKQAGQHETTGAVRNMTAMMARRGPDDEGYWSDPDGHLQLGFRRLSILDLSAAGHQPMVSSDERSVIVLNGEIYNFAELRHELELSGIRFRSRSDTEVLLEALNHWGLDTINRLNGMFAFAWYSRAEQALILARDHAGIKPLYYFIHPAGKGLAFSSQFNQLLHTAWGEPGPVRQDVLRLYMRLHHIPPPYGLLENTFQLEPGHLLIARTGGSIEKRAWWTLPVDAEPDLRGESALEALAAATDSSLRRQRVADVPLGVFLSGGIDSPLVTAVARQQAGPDLKTFTVANPGWWQDESEDAIKYARHFDTDYRVHPATGEEALSSIEDVMKAQHEPFADFSILPALLVSRFARKEVTVALSGDGGDELFFGYQRPLSLLANGSDFRWPRAIRLALYALGKYKLSKRRSSAIVSRTPGHYYFEVNSRLKDEEINRFAPALAPLPGDFKLYSFDSYRGLRRLANEARRAEFYGQLQRGLKKVDMASMRQSLEVRVPLLDREIIEISLRIDPMDCMRNGTRKAPLRDLLGKHFPPAQIPKSKKGFAVPLGDWLRGPLRPLVEQTLFEGDLYPDGILDRKGLRQYWAAHLTGEQDLKWSIWTLLSLQWWAKTHLKSAATAYA